MDKGILLPDFSIDLDANPFIPKGWSVEEHKRGGRWKWDLTELTFYFSKHQGPIERIDGYRLRIELADKPVINANVIDYLLKEENLHLIPNTWKKIGEDVICYNFCWGTIYRNQVGELCVRYLCWDKEEKKWTWRSNWLIGKWGFNAPALCRK